MSSVAVSGWRSYDRAMLQFLFRASQSIFMRGLFAILLFAFIIFGIGDVFRSRGQTDEVASIGRESITPGQLNEMFKRQLDRMGRQMGGKIDPAAAKRAGFLDKTLEAMISDMVIGMAAHDRGFLVGDRLVVEKIQSSPYFIDPVTRQFSHDLFRRLLAQQGLSEADEIRSEKLEYSKQILADTELGPIPVPTELRNVYHRFQAESRRGLAISINSAAMKVPAPTPQQLEDYYTAHPGDFTVGEYRDFSFLYLDADEMGKTVRITPDELKQAYDARQSEFQVPERRDLSQVILRDEAKADQVVSLVRGGKSLAAAVKSVGSSEQTLDLGLMSQQDLPQELQKPVFSAAANSVVDPVKTDLGWHVIAVHRIETPRNLSFDEAKTALEAELKEEKAKDLVSEVTKKIDDSLAGGAALAEGGKPYGLVPITVRGVDSSGRHADGSRAVELGAKESIVKAAFALDKDTPVQMTQDGPIGYAIAIDHVTPPALKPLDAVKPQVVEAYTATAKTAAADALGTKLMQQAAAGQPFAALAKQADTIVTPVGPFVHAGADRGANAPIVAALFDSTQIGQVRLAALKSGPMLIQLSEIVTPPPLPTGEQSAVDRTLQGQMQANFLSEYEQALRSAYRVKINQSVVDQIKAAN